jgi:hypothetical protein
MPIEELVFSDADYERIDAAGRAIYSVLSEHALSPLAVLHLAIAMVEAVCVQVGSLASAKVQEIVFLTLFQRFKIDPMQFAIEHPERDLAPVRTHRLESGNKDSKQEKKE